MTSADLGSRPALDRTSIGALAAAAIAGVVVGAGAGLLLALAVFGAIAGWIALISWRRSLEMMLYYLPFSGLLPLLLYPHQGPATLLKDVAFVIPAYLAALLLVSRRRERFDVPGVPWVLALSFSLLVFVQAGNPHLLKPLIGPIGVKIWLFYIPLVLLGYHMYRDTQRLQQVLKLLTILGMIPCVLGLIEAALVYSGQSSFVYSLYGSAAAATTENFTTFSFGSGSLTRISSIFTFTAQYWFFATAMIAVSWAAWRGNRGDPTMRWLGPVAIVICTFAAMTSGLRAAFIFDPLLLLMMAGLDGLSFSRIALGVIASAVAVAVTLLLLGIPLGPLSSLTSGHTSFILGFFGDGIRFGLHHSLFGLGTGADTNQARYAFSTNAYGYVYAGTGGIWYESWYLKAFLELGVLGLVLFIALLGALLRRSLAAHRNIHDVERRAMSSAFLALFIWTIVFSVKTAAIDEDPLDVYVWLFLGWQWRLGAMSLSPGHAAEWRRDNDAAKGGSPGGPLAAHAGARHERLTS